jgi:hypothetical protein
MSDLFWPAIEIASWHAFLSNTARYRAALPGDVTYLARGHADADWMPTPSLLRLLPRGISPKDALEVEARATRDFREQANVSLDSREIPPGRDGWEFLEWWSLMQHYQAPTRLLDWTTSIFVATYFAAAQLWDRAGAVYIFHYDPVRDWVARQYGRRAVLDEGELRSEAAPAALYHWTPSRRSARLVAQQATFTVALNVCTDHEAAIVQSCTEAERAAGTDGCFKKWIIPGALKDELLWRLRSMNITAQTLFPGADGLGRSVAEVVRLAGSRMRDQ